MKTSNTIKTKFKNITFEKAFGIIPILIALILFVFFSSKSFSQNPLAELEKIKGPNFNTIQKAFTEYWNSLPPDQRTQWKQYKRWEYFWKRRVGPGGEFPDGMQIYKEMKNFNSKRSQKDSKLGLDWRLLGPVIRPDNVAHKSDYGLGRINVIRFHPSDNNILYAGTASGGVWKTIDGGKTWTNLPFTNFLSIGVSDIAISPANPNIIYTEIGRAHV